nr:MAG TPA: hypothetical protein [Caudoviricetes sp.]
MKVDLNKKFKDFKGNETTEVIADKVAEALYSAGAIPEWKIEKKDKFRAYKICQKIINNNGIIDIESEDAALIKDVCSNFLTAGAYGQIHELIEKE